MHGIIAQLVVGIVRPIVEAFGSSARHERQLHARDAEELLDKDLRPPVLYLRSFSIDATTNTLNDSVGHVYAEEEQLAKAIEGIGPFIALDEQPEDLPDLGAARFYGNDSEWMRVVTDNMLKARLVILRVSLTKNVWWELETASKLLTPERLLLLIPFTREEYSTFSEMARSCFPCPFPEYLGSQNSRSGLTGMIYFQPGWVPHFLSLNFATVRSHWAMPLSGPFKTALEPVYEQLQLKWTPAPIRRDLIALLIVPFLILLILLITSLLIKN